MPTIAELRRRHQEQMAEKADVLYEIPGLIGRASDSALQVSGRTGYVYVRIGHDEALAQAYCRMGVRYDMPCVCGFDRWGVFKVLRFRQDEYIAAGFDPIPEIELHGSTHSWPDPSDPDTNRGTDPSVIDWRQILGLRVRITGTWTIQVDGDLLFRNGAWAWIAAQTVDLSSSVPTTYGTRYTLIYLDNDDAIRKSDGAVTSVPDVTAIPALADGETPLAVVMLWKGQTSLRDDAGRRDVEDVRFQGWAATDATGGGSATTQTIATTPRWFADGPLGVVDGVGGVWRIEEAFQVSAVTIYLSDTGTSGTTTVDVEKSLDGGATWASVFASTGNRPSITGGASSNVATGTLAAAMTLPAGTLLRQNIESAATVARGLSVQLSGEEGSILSSGILSAIMGMGR